MQYICLRISAKPRMKNKLYKIASICMITLGVLHTLYFIFSVATQEPVIYQTLSHVVKKGVVWLLGERSLLAYYNGYSLSMGLLLISYGLLTLVTNRTYKAAILSILISFAALVISIAYFHMLAYLLMGLCFIFYFLSLLVKEKQQSH